METWKAEVQTTCHGNWGAAGQNLQCSLNDILFNSRYIAQVYVCARDRYVCVCVCVGVVVFLSVLTDGQQ